MSENAKENTPSENSTNDNLSENMEMDETLSNFLNTDDSRSGGNFFTDEGEDIDEEKEKLRAELEEMKDKHLRLIAEFDNSRRRMAKERMELSQTAGKEVIQSLLTVLDDMDRAAKQLEKATDIEAIREGVSLVFNKMHTALQQKGLRAMDAVNKDFDPDLHEAITEIASGKEEMAGKIIDVVEQGYYLNDKLIRHAKVVVGK